MSLRSRVRTYKEALRASADDLDAPGARARAQAHFLIFDHGILRTFWSNFTTIAPGVFRAAHPSPARLRRWAQRGIKTILNLRGASSSPHYQLEAEACRDLGLTLVDLPGLTARQAPSRASLQAILVAMRSADAPFVLHCKSGADRTSLAAAMYILAIEGGPIARARAQLSPRFLHFKWTKTGILDHILDTYDGAHRAKGIGFEDWLATEYDAEAIQASFDAVRR